MLARRHTALGATGSPAHDPFARPPLDLLLGWSRLVKRCDLVPVGPSICRLQLRYCPCCVTVLLVAGSQASAASSTPPVRKSARRVVLRFRDIY
jgi:hypothetical protein